MNKFLLILLVLASSLVANAQGLGPQPQSVVQVTTNPVGTACVAGKIYYNSITGVNLERIGGVCTPITSGGTPGNVVGPASSIDNEITLFSGAGGKTLKRASGTGIVKETAGVIGVAVAGTDYVATESDPVVKAINGIVQSNGSTISASVVTNDVQTKAAVLPNTLPSAGQIPCGNAGGTAYAPCTVGTDATLSSAGALTLATVNGNVGTFGSATQAPQVTFDAKGRATAAANVTVTPAVGSITGLGTGVATAAAVNVGTAGAFVVNGGVLGTPSSGTLTNATGLPISTGVSGLGTNVGTFLATPSGANLASALTTALPATKGGTGLTALGTNVATALGNTTNGAGGFVTADGTATLTNKTLGAATISGTMLFNNSVALQWKDATNSATAVLTKFSDNHIYFDNETVGGDIIVRPNGAAEEARFGSAGSAFSGSKAIINTGALTKYKNVNTAGWGVPAIYGSGRATAQTAANSSLATYTVGASDGSFIVSANVNVTTSTAHSFSIEVAYTDETNTARVVTFNVQQLGGTLVTAITNVTGAGPYEGVPLHIRAKASTAITIRTNAGGTYTTVTYNAEGAITQIM